MLYGMLSVERCNTSGGSRGSLDGNYIILFITGQAHNRSSNTAHVCKLDRLIEKAHRQKDVHQGRSIPCGHLQTGPRQSCPIAARHVD